MNLFEVKQYIEDGCIDDTLALLYSNLAAARARYLKACDGFFETFGNADNIMLFSAPGRTEVGGNHTDHQNGCVLAGSVDLDVIAVVAATNDLVVRVQSEGYNMDTVMCDNLSPLDCETARSASLIRGMCAVLHKNGYNIGGFNAYTTSNVLKGSGLSSSAAFEVLIGVIINHLFNDGKISAVDVAKFAQQAEREFFGKPCGLMDQMACSVGGFTAIDFCDPKNPIIEKVNFDFSVSNHALCIVNTGGNHTDLTCDYAEITTECAAVSKFFGKELLREVDVDLFYSKIGELRTKVGDRAVLRAFHFFSDNKRAVLEKDSLINNNFEDFLALVNASGNSSFKYLQNVYSPHNPVEQSLSLALALTQKYLNGRGACRVHGGGFAGTIQAFVPLDILDGYIEMIETVFGADNCYVLNIRHFGGMRIL